MNLKGVQSIRAHMTMTLKASKNLSVLVEKGVPSDMRFEHWSDDELVQFLVDKLKAEKNPSDLELALATDQIKMFVGLAKLNPNEKRNDWKCTVVDGPINEESIRKLEAAADFIGDQMELVSWQATIRVDDLIVKLPGFEQEGIPITGAKSCVELARRWLEMVEEVEDLAG